MPMNEMRRNDDAMKTNARTKKINQKKVQKKDNEAVKMLS